MILEILEYVIPASAYRVPIAYAGSLTIFFLGLILYNKIREPISESTEKKLCALIMVLGVLDAVITKLST